MAKLILVLGNADFRLLQNISLDALYLGISLPFDFAGSNQLLVLNYSSRKTEVKSPAEVIAALFHNMFYHFDMQYALPMNWGAEMNWYFWWSIKRKTPLVIL